MSEQGEADEGANIFARQTLISCIISIKLFILVNIHKMEPKEPRTDEFHIFDLYSPLLYTNTEN